MLLAVYLETDQSLLAMSSLFRRPFSLLPVSLILAGAVALPGMVQASVETSAENTEASVSPEVSAEKSESSASPESPADNSEVSASPEISTKVVLLLGRREISVIRDGEKLGPWPVAIGDPRTPTPTGVFKVENKVINPQYQSTKSGRVNPAIGVASPLGDRWIGFLQSGQNQFGIHGTPWPYWVNAKAAVTNGCVRMLHAHVRQLFDVVEVGTTVEILR
ncbi:conserved hypothetical protein [Prochlorococcus marinus str. MIT 9313]|uniref:L,D-TPase catalytic domain-containing protein n=2 Tax=Prochlorococcus marinus TaxID=1219 RepID=Q7V696_PROMM|nr:conserved hypothetical protein [Prochlorococcus marinus str. MIT 9313]